MSDDATPDWVHLPAGVEPRSLWESLHDGEVRALRSDTLQRTATLEIDVPHLRDFHGLGADFRFVLRLGGVRSVRATGYTVWPGGYVRPEGASREEQSRLIEEYRQKGRRYSVDWNALEVALADPERYLDVLGAELATAPDGGTLTLRLSCLLDSDEWHELFLHADSLDIASSDGRALTLEEFAHFGHDYWEAFDARSPTSGTAL